MSHDPEIHEFLVKHLQAIMDNDIDTYHSSTHDELTLYEWWVTPQRIDGIPFHDFIMNANEQRGAVFGSEVTESTHTQKLPTRFDLSNLKIQRYKEAAIASYTLLLSSSLPEGVKVASHNESRVMVKIDNQWQVVHVHKSPAWAAPHMAPTNNA